MKIHTMPQRSPEWYAVRIGKITGTHFPTMAASRKTETLKKLCCRVADERIRGVSEESDYTNADMEAGTAREAEARAIYEATTFFAVREVGFIERDDLTGVSPDGLIGDDGGVEIKCPAGRTHIDYLKERKLPGCYKWQVQGALWVSGRKWWDFVSYHPGYPPMAQMLIVRVLPDPKAFAALEAGAETCRAMIAGYEEAGR